MPKLECEELRLLLDAFEDNELDGVTSLSVQEHLDACAACRAHHFWHAEARAALRRLRADTPGAPAALRARISEQLRPRSAAWWKPAAAAIFVFLAGLGAWHFRPAAAAAEAMEYVHNHTTSLARPDRVKFATADAAAAEAWLRERLDFPLHVPRQPPAGYRLAGARLCSVGRVKVAYLLFEGSGAERPLSLFIGPAGSCPTSGLEPVPDARVALHRGVCEGTTLAAWESRGAAYVLAGEVPPATLLAYTAQEDGS